MNKSYEILEFNKIKEQLAEYACTDSAKKRLRELVPYLSETELLHGLKETTEARKMLDQAGQPPLTSLTDMEKILISACQGGFLLPEQLEYVGSTLAAVRRLKDYLTRLKYLELGLAFYEADLNCMEEIREEIALKIRAGKVDDNASRTLRDLRREAERLETKRKEKADSLLRIHKASLSDSFVTVKSGRVCLPVKKDCRSRVEGSIIEKSATGQTLFIQPAVLSQMDEELSLVRLEEENEERQILYALTGMIADSCDSFHENSRIITKLDFIFAKGRLSCDLAAVEPVISRDQYIEIVDGRHPFLDKEACVPLNFCLGRETKGIVITGPNTGGKTVAIKTVGLLSLMAGCGLHVPCQSGVFSMHNQVLCDIGDGQNITENLSTFSAHITNTLSILRRAGKDSLVIMDELGSGTDPAEGMGIAVAILEELRKSGCLFLVTTHYPEIKTYAARMPAIVNARMAFDKESLRPLYRMEIGEAGESCAFYIAKHLGMPEAMLTTARLACYGDLEEDVCREAGSNNDSAFTAKEAVPRLTRKKERKPLMADVDAYSIGDSVMLPDGKTGIVYRKMDEKGMLGIQIPGKKIQLNYKRVKLQVRAEALYPEDYDFSIVFDSVENRKARHTMERKYQAGLEIRIQE